jgi:hypothetical protein
MEDFGNWRGFFCSKLIEKCKKMSGLFEKHWRVRVCGATSSRFLRDSGSRALASNICHNSQRANSSVFLSRSAPPVKFISCVAESMPLSFSRQYVAEGTRCPLRFVLSALAPVYEIL